MVTESLATVSNGSGCRHWLSAVRAERGTGITADDGMDGLAAGDIGRGVWCCEA